MDVRPNLLPLWLKLAYTLYVCLLVPFYWAQYGPVNFLWFSDIALLTTIVALWLENALLASTMAVSVVLLEIAWNIDFFGRLFTGKHLFGLSKYMFDATIPLGVRALSLFHIVLPPLLLWLVHRLGYDRRAVLVQTVLAWILLPLSYWLSNPTENVNWVYGFSDKPQTWLPAPLFVALLMLALPPLIYLPTHLLLKKLFA
ncbi:MAG: membrane-associated protein [Pyrinomonadaceae bacterium]